MDRRKFISMSGVGSAGLLLTSSFRYARKELKVGMVGLDTSHAPAFTKIINSSDQTDIRITHAYPHGSRTIESSYSRIPKYTAEVKELGVTITNAIEDLLQEVDAVLLETNDGRLHLEQASKIFRAGKPAFIDKPLAASFADAVAIFNLAEEAGVPFFTSSSLRFSPSTQKLVKERRIGEITGADVYSPATIEATHPDLFWYGIHGVESLFTVLGTGCISVQRFYQPEMDLVVGEWTGGRIGQFRGIRKGKKGYGGTAFGTEGIGPVGIYEGYEPLVEEIIRFFQTGIPPVSKAETLEIFAFMAAAEESKRKGGKRVELKKFLKNAYRKSNS